MKAVMLLLFPVALGISPLCAQEVPPGPDPQEEEQDEEEETKDETGPRGFWQASIEGGHYMVALDRIASVSRHKYILDGAMIVDEVTVDTVGRALTRFYFVSSIASASPETSAERLIDRGRELIDRGARGKGMHLQDMVVKKYPDTTHAGTIEYRVLSEQQLDALYSSLKNAWESGSGRQFSTPGATTKPR